MEVEWKCAIMVRMVQCVMRDGKRVMLQSSAPTGVTAHLTIVSICFPKEVPEIIRAIIIIPQVLRLPEEWSLVYLMKLQYSRI